MHATFTQHCDPHPLVGSSTTNRAPPVLIGSHQRRPAVPSERSAGSDATQAPFLAAWWSDTRQKCCPPVPARRPGRCRRPRIVIALAFAATRMITRPRPSGRSEAASIALATRLMRTCSIWTPSACTEGSGPCFRRPLDAARGGFLSANGRRFSPPDADTSSAFKFRLPLETKSRMRSRTSRAR